MTKVDDILADLRKGASLDAIQEKYRSWGQKTEAFRIYVTELDQDAQKQRDQLSPLTSKIKDLQGQRDLLETQVRLLKDSIQRSEKEHKSWEEKTAKEKGQLESELEGLKKTIEKRRGELDKINSTLSDLLSRGVTIEVVTRINDMEFQANENLIEIVKTAADRNRVRIELSELMEKKTDVEKEINSLEKKVEGLRDNIQAEKNTLDESQSKTRSFNEAMNITGWFFSQGYRTEDLKSIKDGIELVGVKGDPTLSVNRLIRGIEEAGSLNNLRDTIKKSREELKTLQDGIFSAEGKLSAIQETVIKAIDKTTDNAVGQIENLGKNSISDIGKLRDNVEKAVKDLEKKSASSIGMLEESTNTRIRDTAKKSCEDVEAVKKEALKSLSGIHAEISAVGTRVSDSMKDVQALGLEDIEKVVKQCQDILGEIQKKSAEEREQQKANREEWGRIQTQAGKLAAELHKANALLAVKSDPQELNLIQSEEIEQLLYRIGQWYRLRSARVISPMVKFSDISTRRFFLGYEPVDFHDTIEWTIAILRLSS